MKLRVTSKREGFRRAGRAWPASGAVVDTKEFSKEQLQALRDEPMLVVEELKDEPEGGKGEGKSVPGLAVADSKKAK